MKRRALSVRVGVVADAINSQGLPILRYGRALYTNDRSVLEPVECDCRIRVHAKPRRRAPRSRVRWIVFAVQGRDGEGGTASVRNLIPAARRFYFDFSGRGVGRRRFVFRH